MQYQYNLVNTGTGLILLNKSYPESVIWNVKYKRHFFNVSASTNKLLFPRIIYSTKSISFDQFSKKIIFLNVVV